MDAGGVAGKAVGVDVNAAAAGVGERRVSVVKGHETSAHRGVRAGVDSDRV